MEKCHQTSNAADWTQSDSEWNTEIKQPVSEIFVAGVLYSSKVPDTEWYIFMLSLFSELMHYHFWFDFYMNVNIPFTLTEKNRLTSQWSKAKKESAINKRKGKRTLIKKKIKIVHWYSWNTFSLVNLDVLLSHIFFCSCSLLCSNYCSFKTYCIRGHQLM